MDSSRWTSINERERWSKTVGIYKPIDNPNYNNFVYLSICTYLCMGVLYFTVSIYNVFRLYFEEYFCITNIHTPSNIPNIRLIIKG